MEGDEFLLAFLLFLALVLHAFAIISLCVNLFSDSSSTASSSVKSTIPVCVRMRGCCCFFLSLVTSAALFPPLLVLHDHTISAVHFPSSLYRLKKRLLLPIMYVFSHVTWRHLKHSHSSGPAKFSCYSLIGHVRFHVTECV